MASGLAHSWAISNMAPKPPDWSTSFCTWATASSGVPITPMLPLCTKSIISLTFVFPSTPICGNAATVWK